MEKQHKKISTDTPEPAGQVCEKKESRESVSHPHTAPSLEQIKARRKYRRIVKLYHFRDYALLYVGLEVVLSVLVEALIAQSDEPIPENTVALLSLVSFLCHAIAVFFGTVHIYLGESSPRLFFKTAIPALALLVIPALLAGYTNGAFLAWCFAPMQLFSLLYAREILNSVLVSCGILVIVVFGAFLFGCWINNARMFKKIRW